MKKKKIWSLAVLVFALVLLLGVYVGLRGKEEPNKDTNSENGEETPVYLLDWNEEKTHKISFFDNTGEKITFLKENGTWKMVGNEKKTLIKEEIILMIEYVSAIEAERTIENVEDLSEYGLDIPLNVIERETEDGAIESFSIGLHSNATGCTYIYLNDKTDVVYAVRKNLGNLYKFDLLDFVEGEAYPTIISDRVQKVEVVKKENAFTLLSDSSAATGWMIEDAVYGKKLADDYEGKNLASMISVINYSAFYEDDCQDFAIYGLDEPQMEIRVTYMDTEEVENAESDDSANSENKVETQTVTRSFVMYVGDLNDEGHYYVRMNDSKEVRGIAQKHIDKLLGETAVDYWALNMGEIVLEKLDYLVVKYEGTEYTLKRVAVENVITYYVNDVEVNSSVFETFYRNAIGIECQERMITCETQTEPELVFEFHGINGEEVTVSYIPWDGSFYAAVNNGTDFGLVNKMNVKSLIESFQNVIA